MTNNRTLDTEERKYRSSPGAVTVQKSCPILCSCTWRLVNQEIPDFFDIIQGMRECFRRDRGEAGRDIGSSCSCYPPLSGFKMQQSPLRIIENPIEPHSLFLQFLGALSHLLQLFKSILHGLPRHLDGLEPLAALALMAPDLQSIAPRWGAGDGHFLPPHLGQTASNSGSQYTFSGISQGPFLSVVVYESIFCT